MPFKSRSYMSGLCSFSLLTLCFLSAASAQDQEPDFAVTLDGDFLSRTIEKSVETSIMNKPYLRWDSGQRIELQDNHVRANLLLDSAKAAAELHGAFPDGTPDVLEIDVEFDIDVYCVAKIPELGVTASAVEVNLGLPWYLDLLLGPFGQVFTQVADTIVRDAAEIPEKISDELRAKLSEKIGQTKIPSCPYTTTASDGSITLEFGGPHDCEDGATRMDPCGSAGTGFAKYQCVNGAWVLEDFGCH